MTRQLVLGTAGHIDHGKTELVRALTGTDTDRLPEEKERGITIDLGFARLAGGETDLAIVDVPGHEAFVRNMVAGATGMDMVLIVVAADEGVMPQTREHVAIAELLGVRAALVAITKTDLVQDDWLELVREDVRGFLADTAFAGAPLMAVSARTGAGIDALRERLLTDAAATAPRHVDDLFRLPVDRVFTVKGTGTVVTGTVWSGHLEDGAEARILPADRAVRVRGLQRHNEPVQAVVAGHRAAVALAGLDRDAVARGDVIVDHPGWAATHMLTVRLTVIPGTAWRIEHRQRVRVHLGTAEVMGRVVLLTRRSLEAGETGWSQLRLEAPLVARAGDRFVVRSYSPVTTIAGGTVAEPLPPKRRRMDAEEQARLGVLVDAAPEDAVATCVRVAAGRGVARERLPLEVAATEPVVMEAAEHAGSVRSIAGRFVDGAMLDDLRDRILGALTAFHEAEPLRRGMDREALRAPVAGAADGAFVEHALDTLEKTGEVVGRGAGLVARREFTVALSSEQRDLRDRIVAAYREAGLAPGTELLELEDGDVQQARIVELLEAEGTLVTVAPGLRVHAAALAEAVDRIRDRLGSRKGLGPGDFREVLGVSRKFLIPLLEYLDGRGVTVRRGAGREVPADDDES